MAIDKKVIENRNDESNHFESKKKQEIGIEHEMGAIVGVFLLAIIVLTVLAMIHSC
jgi:hypothetical protein